MEASVLLAEVPATVRDLVIGHWPETDVECMRARGDCYIDTGEGLNTAADDYGAGAAAAEESVTGATRAGLAERNRTVVAAMRNQATVCADMGRQCHEVADATEQTQHLLVVTGIVLGVQLAYDAMLFFYGGGFKAMADRLAAEQAMRLAVTRLTTHIATRAAAATARRAALHTALHAAMIGGLTGTGISVAAQVWDIQSGARDGFDLAAIGEMAAGGVVGGVVGAEAGRRIAPRVLGMFGRRATSDIGRFGAHLGGTVLIGGVGGVAGGIAGAIPSLIIHHKDIHSFGDMFKMVRESAIVGFGGGFVGAAGNALRVHRAGVDGVRGRPDLPPVARRQLEFGRRVEGLLAGEPPRTEPLTRHSTQGNSARAVELLTFPDGSQVVHKVVSDPRHAHAEFLTSLMGDAVGARVPAVHLDGRHVYMEVVPGKNGQEAYPKDWTAETRFHGTPSGIRLGVLDAIVGVPDRGAENWMITPDAEVWGIDNSLAFTPEVHIGAFAKQFLEYHPVDGAHQWKEHTVTRAELGEIQQRVKDLSPAFSAMGRSGWHDSALARLDQMIHHAPAGAGRGPDIVAPQPHIAGEAPARPRPPATTIRQSAEGRAADTGTSGRPPEHAPPGAPRSRATAHNGETERPPALPPQQESAGPTKTVDAGAAPKDLPPEDGPLPRRETDGPPTRPLPRIDPSDGPQHDPAPAPPPAGQTSTFRHPESGHVDVVFTPPGGAEIPLRLTPGNEYVLGSNKGALLDGVANDYVSRQHATIRVDEAGHVFLRDINSMNGTFIDGKQMVGGESVRVYDGQQLMLSREFELGIDFRRQVTEVQLFGNNAPPLRLYRDSSIGIGRDLLRADSVNRVTMSRDHARVGMDANGRIWLQDTGSKHGTWTNGVRLADGEQRILRPGDTVHFGLAGGEAQFIPADAIGIAAPVQLHLGSGPDAIPINLEPGRSVVLGTDPESPLSAQLGHAGGIGNKHATVGLDHDGRLWIRANADSHGVWVNSDRIDPGQRVTINEGDRIGLGAEFVGTARLGGPDTGPPLAAFRFPPELRIPPIRLHPGQEVPFSIRYYDGDSNVPAGHVQDMRMGTRDVYLGRDADGRVWVRDPQPDLRPPVKVNDRVLEPGAKHYLQPSDTVQLGAHPTRIQLGDESPLSVRLSDDEHALPLTLRRGEDIAIGRDSSSPMARQLAGNESVSPRHATLLRDEYGSLKLRDEHSEHGTWVNGRRIDPHAPAVTLQPGDAVRFGNWPGSAQFTDTGTPVLPRTLPVKLNSAHGDLSFDLPRGGAPLSLGRTNSDLPSVLPRHTLLSRQHAELGVHPSGRVWIRDDGSMNGTKVNGATIPPGVKITLAPGHEVNLGGAYEFTVAFLPAEGGPFVDIIDATPQTRKMVEELSRVPFRIYQRVSEHMNAIPGGGIVIGNRQMLDLPGTSSLQGSTPYGRKPGTSWNTVQGVYLPGPRRIVINTGGRTGSENVVWHEFGHATDAAYGTGGRWLSDQPQWREIHDAMKRDLRPKQGWNSYYDHPREAFAEAFTAWTFEGTSMLKKFTLGDQVMADRLKAYFDRVFR